MPAILCTNDNPGSEIVTTTSSNTTYDWNPLAAFQDAYGVANGLNQYPTANGASLVYDANGNLTDDGAKTFAYDSANRLKSATPNGGTAVNLAYDPASRLYETAGSATTKFLYDGADIIGEYNGSNTLLRRYVHGPSLDEPLAQYDGAGTASKKWLHADARGSIIALSDSSGNVVAKNAYDPYGTPQAGNSGLFQYTGQIWLAEARLYHYKARAYHPGLGRFLQTDPIGYGDGMNMYAYVGNDPVNGRDPSGNFRLTNAFTNCYGNCSGSAGYWNINPGFGSTGGSREDGGRSTRLGAFLNGNRTRTNPKIDNDISNDAKNAFRDAGGFNSGAFGGSLASFATSSFDKINNSGLVGIRAILIATSLGTCEPPGCVQLGDGVRVVGEGPRAICTRSPDGTSGGCTLPGPTDGEIRLPGDREKVAILVLVIGPQGSKWREWDRATPSGARDTAYCRAKITAHGLEGGCFNKPPGVAI